MFLWMCGYVWDKRREEKSTRGEVGGTSVMHAWHGWGLRGRRMKTGLVTVLFRYLQRSLPFVLSVVVFLAYTCWADVFYWLFIYFYKNIIIFIKI